MKTTPEERHAKMVEGYPALRQIAQEVLDFVPEILHVIPYDVGKDFDVISANFLIKQRQHLKSIMALEGNRDAWLIARTMLEGLVQLMYMVRNDRDKLSKRWRTFNLIESWRGIALRKRMGWEITQEEKDKLEGWRQAISGEFFTAEARNALKNGKPLPEDPYVKKWIDTSISQMFRSIKIDDLTAFKLYTAYDNCSSWHHWSPKGLAQAMFQDENGWGYNECRPEEYVMALETGIMCLLDATISTDDYFLLNMSDQIIGLRKKFMDHISVYVKD